MKKAQIIGLFGAGFVVGALFIGLWFGGVGRHQTMTHNALIQQAIGQLAENKVGKDMLEDPHIRDAAVVYFKIRPDSNCMVVLDSRSGEQISAQFSDKPFLKEYMNH